MGSKRFIAAALLLGATSAHAETVAPINDELNCYSRLGDRLDVFRLNRRELCKYEHGFVEGGPIDDGCYVATITTFDGDEMTNRYWVPVICDAKVTTPSHYRCHGRVSDALWLLSVDENDKFVGISVFTRPDRDLDSLTNTYTGVCHDEL
jgi:hypothetical protein